MSLQRIPAALLLAALAAGAFAAQAEARIRVAASITDLASIASSVGGDQVEVFAIARPTNDVHRVEVLPSYMVQVSRANLYLKVGLGLDAWADGIIDGARNPKLKVLDCSKGVEVLEKTASANASMGDVHPFGNPHYWLDPRNGAVVAAALAAQLGAMDPAHAADYRARADAFAKQAEATYARGQQVAATLPSRSILAYHASWVYLADAFGLEVAATAEPVPGIPPTARHLQEIVQIAKAKRIQVFLQEPYFSDDAGRFLAREAGLRVVRASPSCDTGAAGSYLAHFDAVLGMIAGKPAVATQGAP
jgi:zinc/manganese transport system substrate-binding protein